MKKKHVKLLQILASLLFIGLIVIAYLDWIKWTIRSMTWIDTEQFYPASISLINTNLFVSGSNLIKLNQTCEVFKSNRTYPEYPKLIELFKNESIDFECLEARSNRIKTILLWNSVVRERDIGGKTDFQCPISKCRVTDQRSEIDQSDLVLVNLNDNISNFRPSKSQASTLWAYIIYKPILEAIDLISYESHSTLVPYHFREANIKWNTKNRSKNWLTNFDNKLNAIAAILDGQCSNHWLLKHLKRYFKVDIYGECGNLVCGSTRTECLRFIAAKYKFYFVTEPRICLNYVSERFFEILKYDIVPIVAKSFDHESYVPESAFIDASRFTDLNDLGKFLARIGSSPDEYKTYFEWKNRVRFGERGINPFESILCDLCVALHIGLVSNQRVSNHNNCFRIRIFDIVNYRFDIPM